MKVLHIVGAMNLGGQETFIMNVYRNINRDAIQFDFVVSNDKEGYFDNEIKKLGGNIYYVPPIKGNVIKRCIKLYKLIKANGYTVVHRHSAFSIAFIDLLVSFIAGVKTRIIHSHADYDSHKSHFLFIFFVNAFSNKRFACSEQAAKWMFGKRSKKHEIINNGIDINRFSFNQQNRIKIRNELGIKDDVFLLGHSGRFTEEKNQEFLFDVLANIISKNPKTKLCLLGDGKLKQNYINKCETLGICDYVLFLGSRDNVEDYLSAFDLYLFPSIHEGLGISLIEAEVNGLSCLTSNMINEEAIISSETIRLPLDKKVWISEINKRRNNNCHVELSNIDFTSFDIINTVKRLENIYVISKTS